jgi:hypothetical protein
LGFLPFLYLNYKYYLLFCQGIFTLLLVYLIWVKRILTFQFLTTFLVVFAFFFYLHLPLRLRLSYCQNDKIESDKLLKKYTTLPLAITQAKPEQGLTKYLNLTARYTKPAKLIWLAVPIKLL